MCVCMKVQDGFICYREARGGNSSLVQVTRSSKSLEALFTTWKSRTVTSSRILAYLRSSGVGKWMMWLCGCVAVWLCGCMAVHVMWLFSVKETFTFNSTGLL